MNPLAYSTAIQACQELMVAQHSGDRQQMRRALCTAAAAVHFEASPITYYIASKPVSDTPMWFYSEEDPYCCAFEAEAAADTTPRIVTPVPWKIIALTGLESTHQTKEKS